MDNQKFKIKQEYTKVWDVVKELYKLSNNNWDEVAQFLGHHDFDTKLQLYHVDCFLKIHKVNSNLEPIRDLIEKLSFMWLESDNKELSTLQLKLDSYYWGNDDLYYFDPLISIGFALNTVASNNNAQQTEPNTYNLNTEIKQLKELVANKDAEIEQLKNQLKELKSECVKTDLAFDMTEIENSDLKEENQQLKLKIQQLEAEWQIIQDDKPDLLTLIFDDTQTDRYAPDLVLAIKLWEDLYINNPRRDSHSNKANLWIDENTGYGDTSKGKLREITTPFINWSTHRDKKYKK